MVVFKYSNKGSRPENQDFIVHKELSPAAAVFVVADGMGGYTNGGIAARVVAESVVEYTASNLDKIPPTLLLKEAVNFSNASLMLKRLALGGQRMGCVVAILLLVGSDAYMTWLGDSRIYIYRDKCEVYRTEDHSVINELGKIGTLNAYSCQKYASVVTRSVMGDDKLGLVEVSHAVVETGDIFVLCTDGFYREINMELAMNYDGSQRDALDERAQETGDNFSFIKIEV